MKGKFTAICLIMAFWSFGQTDEEIYGLKASDSTVISDTNFTLIIRSILENKYNDHYSRSGPDMIEFGGYSLAETLTQLGKRANTLVQVQELKNNPKVVLKVLTKKQSLIELWPSILNQLGTYYHFTSHTEVSKISVLYLTTADKNKLNKALTKSKEPGMIKSASSKNGASILVKYNLKDLAEWLETPLHKSILVDKSSLTSSRYDFKLSTSSNLQSSLLNDYGLELKETQIDSKIYIVN